MIIEEIDSELEKYEQALQCLKEDLITRIRDLPDNPKIHRVKGNPRCFVMRSNDLGECWSPEYHDSWYWECNTCKWRECPMRGRTEQ